jgi:ATP-dependent helicase/nuclease subunit A
VTSSDVLLEAKVPADEAARARIRDDHATSMVVEAAAGTGKTSALVSRLVAMLRRGTCELERVVAVTFTDKAAGEMTLRIREALERARAEALDADERARCERALEQLETARVGTIHGFCGDLLRERPVEAGIDPSFTVLADDESQSLAERALSEVLGAALAAPGEGLRRLLRRTSRGQDTPRDRLRTAVRQLIEYRDHDAPWGREPFDREPEIDAILGELGELAALAAQSPSASDWCAKSLVEIGRIATDAAARERAAPRDYDALEAALCAQRVSDTKGPWTWRGSGKTFAPGILRSEVIQRRDRVREKIARFAGRADADLAACLWADLRPVVARYEVLKKRIGALDFLDLMLGARRMLIEHDEVRADFQSRFTHLFLDEAQDTDPLQVDIVLLLSADDPGVRDPAAVRARGGKLFVVGDPKQSIYRFRRASLATYERMKDQLVASGAALLQLTTSFRSLPGIQRVVNAAFGAAMQGEGQPEHVALTEWREAETRRPSVIALPIPRPYAQGESVAKNAIEASTPGVVAAFVSWLVHDSGWKVLDPVTGLETPVAARHVCLLFRRFQTTWSGDIVRPYLRELEARRVPHVWASGRSFHEREEIIGLRAIAAAIEHPDDALAVYAALRGPFLALTDAELLLFRDRVGALHPMRRHEAATIDPSLRPVAAALALLRELHLGRNRQPIANTFARFFEETRAHAALALAQGGEEVLASAMRILDLARRFDQRGALSFRGFVELLEEQAERGEGAGDAPSSEEGQEGVRVMNVFKAKGLEFPVVVLCDPTASAGGWVDRSIDHGAGAAYFKLADLMPAELRRRAAEVEAADRAEMIRLAYVAATRARDLLVVPACGDGPFEGGWLSVIERAIHPPEAERRQGEGRAPGCPTFGDESVVSRTIDAEASGKVSVRPGLHRSVGAVWWDPNVLALDVETRDGLRGDDVLRSASGVDDGTRAHRSWVDAHTTAIEDGAIPSIDVTTVRALAREARAPAIEPEIERAAAAGRGDRPEGKRIEALFRGVLPMIAPEDDDAVIGAWVRARARAIGADDLEERAVREAAIAVARHPSLAGGEGVQRAVPFAWRDARGAVVEGTIDLLRESAGSLVAVRIVLASADPSEAQRAEASIAAQAIAEILDRPVRALVLAV